MQAWKTGVCSTKTWDTAVMHARHQMYGVSFIHLELVQAMHLGPSVYIFISSAPSHLISLCLCRYYRNDTTQMLPITQNKPGQLAVGVTSSIMAVVDQHLSDIAPVHRLSQS